MTRRTRLLVVPVLVALMLVALAVPAFAAGRSGIGHVSLFAKTPTASGPWEIIEGGASGKMMYKRCPLNTLPQFVFNGHGLDAGVNYALVNYQGGSSVGILGTGVADEFGDVHIAGSYGELLSDNDPVTPGAKIWLIPTASLAGTTIVTWDMPSWLFEGEGILLN